MLKYYILGWTLLVSVYLGSCSPKISVSHHDNTISIVEVPSNPNETVKTYVTMGDDCRCSNKTCQCCFTLDIPQIGLYFDGCGKVKYDPVALKIDLIISINDRIIIDEKVSAHNPPPVCVGKPFTLDIADACIRLYDLDYSKDQFKGCARLEGRLEEVEVVKVELGCWDVKDSH